MSLGSLIPHWPPVGTLVIPALDTFSCETQDALEGAVLMLLAEYPGGVSPCTLAWRCESTMEAMYNACRVLLERRQVSITYTVYRRASTQEDGRYPLIVKR